MSEHFETQLRLQLRAAAERMERRGAFGRLRLALPAAPAVAAGALVAVVLLAVAIAGGLRWAGDDDVVTAPRVVANIALADNLGSVDSGLGAVWVADTAKGQILRLDPRTRQVRARIPVGGEAWVTVGAGAVWAVSARVDAREQLVRIDPATNRVTARVPLRLPGGAPLSFASVHILGGAPWVVGAEGALRINALDGHVEHFTRLEGPQEEPRFVTGTDDSLWVLNRQQQVQRYDLDTGRRISVVPVRMPEVTAVLPTPAGLVYITHEGDIARADSDDGRIAWRHKLGTSVAGLPLRRGSTLWIHASDAAGRDRLVELDLDSGEILSRATLPEFGAAGGAFVGRQFWLATPNGRLMVLQR
jgi:streptogramin lyase